jgi:hypothetical protein
MCCPGYRAAQQQLADAQRHTRVRKATRQRGAERAADAEPGEKHGKD